MKKLYVLLNGISFLLASLQSMGFGVHGSLWFTVFHTMTEFIIFEVQNFQLDFLGFFSCMLWLNKTAKNKT